MSVDVHHVSGKNDDVLKPLVDSGFLQSVLELASAYEEGKITSVRFAEKVCGLRNIYYSQLPTT